MKRLAVKSLWVVAYIIVVGAVYHSLTFVVTPNHYLDNVAALIAGGGIYSILKS